MFDRQEAIILVAGAALIVGGIAVIYWPAAMIMGGVLLVVDVCVRGKK